MQIAIDVTKYNGKIKPLNAVNNGPVTSRTGGNVKDYAALEIPFARYHDSAFSNSYGGEFSVDVHRIFRDFDKDENDPQNYIFAPTDKYVSSTIAVGTKPYYRLGASIEHGYKFGTYPPKDFNKWARICANIIRHYTQGWGNGFNYDIEYWEIWNEPDCVNPNGENPCWQGTNDLFIDFYEVAAKHLKKEFPHLKIGGPAFTSSWNFEKIRPFLKAVKERNIPMDFYSFHGYAKSPQIIRELADAALQTFEEAGLEKVEFHLNEWNYVRSWGDDFAYSARTMYSYKGASFVLGAMCMGQDSCIDMMMYYDARPSLFNGLFSAYLYERFKTYYVFDFFKDVRKLGNAVKVDAAHNDIYVIASKNDKECNIALTYFNDNESTPDEKVDILLEGVPAGSSIELYLVDATHSGELVSEIVLGENRIISLDMKLYDSYLIKIKEA